MKMNWIINSRISINLRMIWFVFEITCIFFCVRILELNVLLKYFGNFLVEKQARRFSASVLCKHFIVLETLHNVVVSKAKGRFPPPSSHRGQAINFVKFGRSLDSWVVENRKKAIDSFVSTKWKYKNRTFALIKNNETKSQRRKIVKIVCDNSNRAKQRTKRRRLKGKSISEKSINIFPAKRDCEIKAAANEWRGWNGAKKFVKSEWNVKKACQSSAISTHLMGFHVKNDDGKI